jgi:hypothetical protein
MDKKQKEKIAINAANTWCRCFKCDGIIRDTNDKCDKDKLLTCHQWFHGYRTALLALNDYEQQMMKDAVVMEAHEEYGELWGDITKCSTEKGKKYKVIIINED